MNFKNDLAEIASAQLAQEGISIPPDWNEDDVCINFFELTHRWFDSSIPYKVVYSQELLAKMRELTDEEILALKDIEERLANRKSITQYMSRGIKETNIKKSDFLLKNWNIYHLHLEKFVPPIARYTKPNLLFFQPKGQVVHFIDVLPHPSGVEWFKRELLETIYKNWPNLLKFLNGVKPTQEIPDDEIHNLTKQVVTIIDFHGGALIPSNHGVVCSGHSYMAVDKAHRIFNKLRICEQELAKKEDEIKRAILKSTGKSINEALDYKLIIESECFVAQEKHTLETINLFPI